MLQYPFPDATKVLQLTPAQLKEWPEKTPAKLPVRFAGDRVSLRESTYRLLRLGDALHAVRPANPGLVLGEIHPSGVRRALTTAFQRELGAIHAAMYVLAAPAPLAYQLRDGTLVHPGKCFMRAEETLIAQTHFSLDRILEDPVCAVCGERFI